MNKYRPVYRCRLCSATITDEYTQMEPSVAVRCANGMRQVALYGPNPYLGGDKSKGLHNCDDGSVGVADFCGMERRDVL